MSSNNSTDDKTTLGGTKQDLTRIFAFAFLTLFAIIIILIVSQADFTQIAISGTLDVNTFMVAFMGIIVALVGWLGITKGRQDTTTTTKTKTT